MYCLIQEIHGITHALAEELYEKGICYYSCLYWLNV